MAVGICILILAFLTVAVWVYHAILLPSIRQRLRFDLFRLRDETRQLVLDGVIKEDGAVFRYLHRQLNLMIAAVPKFDFALVTRIRMADIAEIEKRAEEKRKLIEDSNVQVRQIYDNALKVMAIALAANSGFWFLLFAIAAIPAIPFSRVWSLRSVIRDRMRAEVKPAFGLREQDLEAALC